MLVGASRPANAARFNVPIPAWVDAIKLFYWLTGCQHTSLELMFPQDASLQPGASG